MGAGFGGRDEAGRRPRDDLQYGSEPSFVSTRTKMSSASQISTESITPLQRWVFNDAQQNVPMGSYASSVAESMSDGVVSPDSDASSMLSSYRPPSLTESIKSVEIKKKPSSFEDLVGGAINMERAPFNAPAVPFTATRNLGETSRRRQVFDPKRYDSLGRARRITEDGEVIDITPAPPLVNLVDDTKPLSMGVWDGKPGHIRRPPVTKKPMTGSGAELPIKKPGDAFGGYSFQLFSAKRRMMSGSSPLLDIRNPRVGGMWNSLGRKSKEAIMMSSAASSRRTSISGMFDLDDF